MIALICIYTLHVKIPSNVYLCLYILSKSGLQRPGIYNAGVLTCIFIYSWNILVPKIWTLLSPTVLKLINVLDWLYNTLVVYPTCNYLKRIQYDTSLLYINTDDKLETTVKQVLVFIWLPIWDQILGPNLQLDRQNKFTKQE